MKLVVVLLFVALIAAAISGGARCSGSAPRSLTLPLREVSRPAPGGAAARTATAQRVLVFDGLREYFQLCREARNRLVAMPSQVVDDAWHEFILFTRQYQQFCERGLGRFLHHTPAEAMRSPTDAQDGIKRAWRLACRRDGIDPKAPQSLPLLFALDACSGSPGVLSISSIAWPQPATARVIAPATSVAGAAVAGAAAVAETATAAGQAATVVAGEGAAAVAVTEAAASRPRL
jgi:hypothetical protein